MTRRIKEKNSNGYDSEINEEYENNQDSKKRSKKKFLWLILLVPILVIAGFFGYKALSDPGDVTVSNFKFSEEYELQDGTYVFDEGKDVELTITLKGSKSDNIDEKKVSYVVDNPDVCTYRKIAYNQFELIGMSKGNTTIHIYYGGIQIKTLDVGFADLDGDSDEENIIAIDRIQVSNMEKKDSTYVLKINKNAEIQVTLKGKDANDELLSYSIDDTSLASIYGYQKKCKISGKQEGSTTLRILYDGKELHNISLTVEKNEDGSNSNLNLNNQVDSVINEYWSNYSEAVNSGDISYIQDYITSTGQLHNELTTKLSQYHQNNISINIIGYTKDSMKAENNAYRVGMTIQSNEHQGQTTKYKKQYMEFIVIQESGQWLIDKVENKQTREEHQI